MRRCRRGSLRTKRSVTGDRRLVAGGFVVALAFAMAVGGAGPAVAQSPPASDISIVRLARPPLALYAGGTAGLAATAPAVTGRRLSRRSAAVRGYRGFLADEQARVVARAERAGPRVSIARSYRVATAGFAAALTRAQIASLRADPRVAAVEPNTTLSLDAVPRDVPPAVALGGPVAAQSAELMGLPEGIWAAQGGPIDAGGAGAGTVIGILDTGIDPSLPSFASASAGDTVYTGDDFPPAPDSFAGTCEAPASGEPPSAVVTCTDKVVGARWYHAGGGPYPGTRSPLDTNGHGTHVASIAAGNYGVTPSIGGSDQGIAALAGIAPRAHVASYKVCWAGCPVADILAGFDDAVADGVDVINTSFGSGFLGPPNAISLASLAAQAAGIPVARSAGNSGNASDTVGQSTAAWWSLTVGSTIGAGTTAGPAVLTVPALSEDPILGLAASPVVGSDGSEVRELHDATRYATGSAEDARLCKDGSLSGIPPGAYVLCYRGETTFAAKMQAVASGGAGTSGGVVFVNDERPLIAAATGGSTMPAMMISRDDGDELREFVASTPAEVSMATAPPWHATAPDVLYTQSSRGPTELLPDLMTVSVAAPGVGVPAAFARAHLAPGDNAAFMTGTSMASPQVAGALALLRREHPDWSPEELRSALVTTARPVRSYSVFGPPPTPYEVGGGRIDPNAAADPGLIVAAEEDHYDEVLRSLPEILGEGAPVPDLGPQRDPADLNVPAVVLRSLSGVRTVTRTVRSVASRRTSWSAAAANVPAGWSVTTAPASFSLMPGEERRIAITVGGPDGADEMAAQLVLSEVGGAGRQLRLPIAARTTAAAPGIPRFDIETTAAAGSFPVPPPSFPTPGAGASAGVGRLAKNVGFVVSGADACGAGYTETVAVPAGTAALLVDARMISTDRGLPPVMSVRDPEGVTRLNAAPVPELHVLDAPQAGTWTIRLDCATGGSQSWGAQLKVGLIGVDGIAASVTPGDDGAPPSLSWSGLAEDGDYVGYVRVSGGAPRPDQLFVVHRRAAPTLTGVSGTELEVAADAVSSHDVKVTGAANPSGAHTWMRVEHGPTTAYGESTEPMELGAGTDDIAFDVPLGTLAGGDVRHARVVLERRGQMVAASDDVLLAVSRRPEAPDDSPAAGEDVVDLTTPPLPPGAPAPAPAPGAAAPAKPAPGPRAKARACARRLVGKARKAAMVTSSSRRRRLLVRLRPARALEAVRVELRRASPCSRRRRPLVRVRRSSLRARSRSTVSLRLPRKIRPGAYVLLVSGKRGRRTARSALVVTVR